MLLVAYFITSNFLVYSTYDVMQRAQEFIQNDGQRKWLSPNISIIKQDVKEAATAFVSCTNGLQILKIKWKYTY